MIRLSKSVVGKAESTAVAHIIEDIGYLGMGETVGEFEKELEEYVGGNTRCICVNSGTAALHLAIQAVTNPGDEILVPSFTFVSTYQAITGAGCKSISCDIDPISLTLDIRDAEKRITPRTTAILPVYYASNTSMADTYRQFAHEHNLKLIEDAAHAFGARNNGKIIGSSGEAVCFSFDGIKNITSGEGGAIFSSNPDVVQAVSDARLLGVMKDSDMRYKGQRSWIFDVVNQGYRYHMSNIFAAIGKVQLSRFEKEFAPKRKYIAKRYTQLLGDNKNLRLTPMNYDVIVPHIFALQVMNGRRDDLIKAFKEYDIQCGVQYRPNHLLSYFKSDYHLPVTEEVYSRIISIPMHPELSDEDIEQICSVINETVNK